MERIFYLLNCEDFNSSLTNLLVDLYSSDYKKYFKELWFDDKQFDNLDKKQLDRLTKIATIIEYIGNRKENVELHDWIYSSRLKLEYPYTPGVENNSISRVKRIIFAPKEFSVRNVFFEESTLKPI